MKTELTIERLRTPLKIGSKHAPNRVVYQPTESNNADRDGNVTDLPPGPSAANRVRRNPVLRPGAVRLERCAVRA